MVASHLASKPRWLCAACLTFAVVAWSPRAEAQAAPKDKAAQDKASKETKADAAKADAPGAPAEEPSAPGETPAEEPSPETVKRAASHFERGLQLYNDAEYRLALIEFERAYQLVPNYRVKYNIAQVSIQIGRYARAVHALEDYLKEGGDQISPERRAQVENDQRMLAGRTARVNIVSNVEGAEILLDEAVVAQTPLQEKLLIDAGEHTLTVRQRGYQQRTEQLTVAGGDDVELTFQLSEVKTENPVVIVKEVPKNGQGDAGVKKDEFPYATVGWITTGALASAAIITGVIGLKAKDELDRLAEPDPNQDPEQKKRDMEETEDRARNFFLASDICTGAAVVAGAASLYFTLKSPGSSSTVGKASSDSFSMRAGAGINHVWVSGQF